MLKLLVVFPMATALLASYFSPARPTLPFPRALGKARKPPAAVRHNGFTGPHVPALPQLRGDYVNVGLRTPEGRTDIPALIAKLQELKARDYLHLVWRETDYPGAWDDFQRMAPLFQAAGIRLWLYLTPPTEGVPEPFGADYVRWTTECAALARQYPMIKGVCIDDLNWNTGLFTPAYCQVMMSEAHRIAPHLALLAVCYYGFHEAITAHVEAGAIDGVIFPYFYPHKNHSNTDRLGPQIGKYRAWLDERTKAGGLAGKMPLVVMVYASRHSQAPDIPTPVCVQRCLETALKATRNGQANGVVTYCLPKDNPEFIGGVAAAYRQWDADEHVPQAQEGLSR